MFWFVWADPGCSLTNNDRISYFKGRNVPKRSWANKRNQRRNSLQIWGVQKAESALKAIPLVWVAASGQRVLRDPPRLAPLAVLYFVGFAFGADGEPAHCHAALFWCGPFVILTRRP